MVREKLAVATYLSSFGAFYTTKPKSSASFLFLLCATLRSLSRGLVHFMRDAKSPFSKIFTVVYLTLRFAEIHLYIHPKP